MTLQIDKDIILWINALEGKSAILDRVMMVLANDYLVPVTIALMLMAIWFLGRTAAERGNYQRAVVCAAISIGSACGLALATNHLYRHPPGAHQAGRHGDPYHGAQAGLGHRRGAG